jgi:hypothetical protein
LSGADLLDALALGLAQGAVVLLPRSKPELEHVACQVLTAGLPGGQPEALEQLQVALGVATAGTSGHCAGASSALPTQDFVGVFAFQPGGLAILIQQLRSGGFSGVAGVEPPHHAGGVFAALFHQSWLHRPWFPL